MGFFTAGGSFARIVGPLWSTAIYNNEKWSESFVFLITCSGLVLMLFLLVLTSPITHKLMEYHRRKEQQLKLNQ
jgi:hypothetical protein